MLFSVSTAGGWHQACADFSLTYHLAKHNITSIQTEDIKAMSVVIIIHFVELQTTLLLFVKRVHQLFVVGMFAASCNLHYGFIIARKCSRHCVLPT